MQTAFDCLGHIFNPDRFRRVVADSARSSQKDHGGRNFLGQDHRVMSGAADHAVRFASGLPDRLFDFIDEK